MPNKPQSRCGQCQQLHTGTGTCNACRMRDRRARRPELRSDQDRRAQAVQDWRDQYGDVCPGWERDPHEATDLTADHIHAVATGGDETGPLAVLCRTCNAGKGAST
jgi:5-methylcytosine-specific restriction protein A